MIARLDLLHSLGVRTIWLSPVFRMRTEKFFGHGAFHGYWVSDLEQLEPRFGDTATLRRLSDALHQRGMKLLLDVVLNHVGPDTPLVSQRPDWFHRKGPLTEWGNREQLETHDVHGLPDLAVEKPEVYAYLTGVSKQWIDEVKPDGFRLDAVKHLGIDFWRRYNAELRAHAGPSFELLGEYLEGNPSANATVFREGGFTSMFDFPLHFAMVDVFCRGRAAPHLGSVLTADRLYEQPSKLVTLLDNHDLPRVLTACGGDLEKVKRALLFQLTARGIPSLTWGTEVGLTGEKEPENRADMRFEAHPLRDWISKLLAAREASPAARNGKTVILFADDQSLVTARVSAEEALLSVLTGSGEAPRLTDLPELAHLEAEELVTGEKVQLGQVKLAPGSVRVFKLRPTSKEHGLKRLQEAAEAKRTREVLLRGPKGMYAVGSGAELGAWDATKAIGPLGDKPLSVTLPERGVFEFKYIRREGTEVKWEEGPNRILFVPPPAERREHLRGTW